MTQATPRPQAGVGGSAGVCEAGLAPGTQVLTTDGAIPVEFLNPGDRIITRRGVRKLKAVMRHTIPEGTPVVRVAADALGGKPSTDITLMPGQRVLVRDWRAKALWGKDIAAVPATRLVDGNFITSETSGRQIMLSLYFGAPEILYADGLELASADKPKVSAKAK
ncbi:hypothetical protein HKCCE4037_12805 [Rhodobacterales bacterium HKCCE4037]|nr:hypothetical protein [Rhodobacterales bacterium HKCCE4037]